MRKKSEEKCQNILDIATSFFLEKGYDATSVSEISAKVGGSKATIYNHFQSKEELFIKVISQSAGKLASKAFNLNQDKKTTKEILEKFAVKYVNFITSDEMVKICRCIIADAHKANIGKAIYERGIQKKWLMISEILANAMTKKELKKCDPWKAAMYFKGLLDSEFQYQRFLNLISQPSPAIIKKHCAEAINIFWSYYKI